MSQETKTANEEILKTKPSDNIFKRFSNAIYSVRFISILGILIFHYGSWSHWTLYYSVIPITPSFISIFDIGEIGVDLFAVLSSLFLTINLANKDYTFKDWKKWGKDRILRIFPLLWIGCVIVFVTNFFTASIIYSFNSILVEFGGMSGLFGMPIIGYLWFISFILTCYLIFPFVLLAMKKNFNLTAGILIGALVVMILVYYPLVIIAPGLSRPYLGIHRYFSFLMGMVLGFWIGKNSNENMKYFDDNRFGLISFLGFVGACIYSLINAYIIPHFIGAIYHERLVSFILISITFIPFFAYLFCKVPKLHKPLISPGKRSYEIFLIHEAGYGIMSVTLVATIVNPYIFYTLEFLIFVIIIILISIPMNIAIKKILRTEKLEMPIVVVVSSLIVYSVVQFIIAGFGVDLGLIDPLSLVIYTITIGCTIGVYFILKIFFQKRHNQQNIL